MELIISAPLDETNDNLDQLRVREIETKLAEFDENYSILETNICRGADWTVLLLTMAGVFLLGEKIQKNLDAWLAIGKKTAELLKWVSDNFGGVRIDASGAVAIAIEDLVRLYPAIRSLTLEDPQTVVFTPVPWNPSGRLDSRPDALFVLTCRVNNEDVVVYGVKSKGTIEFRHTFKEFWG